MDSSNFLYALAGTIVVVQVFLIIWAIGIIVSNCFIFKKAGEPWWKALIPFYNTYTLTEISMGNGWLFLVLLIPLVNIVFPFILYIDLAKSFGRGAGFGVGLTLLAPIFELILAFNSDEYIGPKGEAYQQDGEYSQGYDGYNQGNPQRPNYNSNQQFGYDGNYNGTQSQNEDNGLF